MSSGFGEIFLNFILENNYKQYVKGDRHGRPLLLRTRCLFSSLLLGFDLGLHLHDQLGKLFLAFLSCLGVYVLGYAFAVDSRREPSFVEVVV